MKRALLFAFLVLVLPKVGFASSVVFSTGLFRSGQSSGSASTTLDFTVTGSLASITVDTGALTQLSNCPPGQFGTCFSFSSGDVTVKHGGSVVFNNALNGGTIDQEGRTFIVVFNLTPGRGVPPGSAGQSVFLLSTSPPVGNFAGTMTFGTTTVVVIPEPGSLELLGAGLIGLATMVRSKIASQKPSRSNLTC